MAKIGINIKKGIIEKDAPKDIIVGIDLGTTNSLVAYIHTDTGEAIAIKDPAGSSKLVPSIVHFPQTGAPIVGNEAKEYLVTQPENTIYSVKRLMGKSFGDVGQHSSYFGYQIIDDNTESLVKIRVQDRFYTPIELSSFILKALKERIENALNQTVSKAVITVPAYFNDAQRQATRDAGKLAGLEVLRIVNEPTAASLAYGLGTDAETAQTIAVYDLGGGTFDISILHIENGIFEVLATNGDTFLGGDDFDRVIIDYWLQSFPASKEQIILNKKLSQQLRLKAEAAKIALSKSDTFSDTLFFKNKEEKTIEATLQITRLQFEQLIEPLLQRTIDCCKNALKDAELTIADIDQAVLVGGSTRTPAVKQAVADFFGKPPHDQLNPDEVVALGAAVQADILAGNRRDTLLLDVTPLSLGIETMGGLMDVIIPRNSKLPTKAGRQYTTQKDGQSAMRISVFQGERDLVADNRKLGEFHLKGIPGMPAGLPKVEVSFIIDADGITRVRAKELRSGVEQSIAVKPQYGLSEAEMGQMLLDSIKNAQNDMAIRALQEAVNEANNIISTTERFLKKHTKLLHTTEIDGTNERIADLQTVLNSSDKDLIHSRIETLNDFTKPFAHRIMDMAISAAMKGQDIASINKKPSKA